MKAASGDRRRFILHFFDTLLKALNMGSSMFLSYSQPDKVASKSIVLTIGCVDFSLSEDVLIVSLLVIF